jgi:Amt family ammonium transporter
MCQRQLSLSTEKQKVRTMSYVRKMMYLLPVLLASVVLFVCSAPVSSAAGPYDTIGSGDIWVVVASVLVFLMIPGLAIFYGGLLRKESMISILVQTTIVVILSGVVWIVCGYSLAFSGGEGDVIGNLDYFFLDSLVDDMAAGWGTDSLLFAVFQMKFVLITAAIIIGACAERIRFKTIAVLAVLWPLLVYVPACHCIWGGGYLAANFTIVDYAGGTVVHTLAGMSGLALAVFAGLRATKIRDSQPHNVPFVYLGVFLLWVGWYGFNGGSGLGTGGTIVRSIVTTTASAVGATLVWMAAEYYFKKQITVIGVGTGILAGLVFITPMAAYVSVSSSFAVGIIGGTICYIFSHLIHVTLKNRIDDALDVFVVHGVGGIFGTILTAFLVQAQYGSPVDGILFGGPVDVLIGNCVAIAVCAVLAFVVTYAVIFIGNKLLPGKLTEEEIEEGQDLVEHHEDAYN